MTRETYSGRKRFSKCVRCGASVAATRDGVNRALTGFLTVEQISRLDALLASEFEPDSGMYEYVHAEDTCPTCVVELMAGSV